MIVGLGPRQGHDRFSCSIGAMLKWVVVVDHEQIGLGATHRVATTKRARSRGWSDEYDLLRVFDGKWLE